MDCATAREAISALADGEDPGAELNAVEGHLAECAGCRNWQDAAHEITRRVRLGVTHPAPVSPQVVAAAGRVPSWVSRRGRLVALARVGLVAVAAGQFALTVPFLVLGHDHGAPEHVAHEMGAFSAALAAGFVLAAWQPGRALGMRILVGVASLLLVVTAVIDVEAGRTSVGDEAPHLLAVAGWLMIRYLAARTPPAAAQSLRPGSGSLSWRAWRGRHGSPPEPAAADRARWRFDRPASVAAGSLPLAVRHSGGYRPDIATSGRLTGQPEDAA